MKKLSKYIYLVSLFLCLGLFAQSNSVVIKSWVKQNAILLRWAPTNKSTFEAGVKYGYKLIRKDKSGQTVILNENIKPYSKTDSVWYKLLKSNPNAALALSALYNNTSKVVDAKQKQKQELMVYNMLLLSCDFDSQIAKACGLYYKDSTISNTNEYQYSLIINNPAIKVNAALNVNASVLSFNPVINNLQGLFKTKSVKLRWNAKKYTNDYAGYNIERSTDSVHYSKINQSPVILLASQFEKNKELIYYLDTFPSTKQKYYYRIRGLNHFGEWSEPSNVLSAIGYEPLKSFPVFDTIYTISNQRVYMKWRMGDKKENNLPKAYYVSRSISDKGKYELVYTTNTNFEFTDENPNPTNFYKINAIGFGGDTLSSFSYMALIIDTIPPVKPQGLKAKVDSKGLVTLSWDKNPESDIRGYKIFRSNALHEEFVQINNEFAKEPNYTDKLNLKTLSKKVYYRVSAADNRFNNSEQSEIVEVKRPDTIAPVAAIVTKLELNQKGIKISWINSNSEDVKYSVLYRTSADDKEQTKIMEWRAKDSVKSCFDSTLIMGEGYRYKIVVGDEDDNISISNNPYILYETGFRRKITDVKFSVDRTQKTITLGWNYNEKGVERFVIYRCKKGGALTIIKTIDGNTTTFIDNTTSISNIYEYRIKPVFTNGAEGVISDGVVVEY